MEKPFQAESETANSGSDSIPSDGTYHRHYNLVLAWGTLLTLLTWGLGLTWPQPSGHWSFWVCAAVWFLYAIWVGRFFWRMGHGRVLWLPCITMIILGVGVSIPAELMNAILNPVNRALDQLRQQFPGSHLFNFTAGKLAHFMCFLVVSFALLWKRRRLKFTYLHLMGLFLILALSTEGLQLFLRSRTTSVVDIGIDGAGYVAGLLLFLLARAIPVLERRRSRYL